MQTDREIIDFSRAVSGGHALVGTLPILFLSRAAFLAILYYINRGCILVCTFTSTNITPLTLKVSSCALFLALLCLCCCSIYLFFYKTIFCKMNWPNTIVCFLMLFLLFWAFYRGFDDYNDFD